MIKLTSYASGPTPRQLMQGAKNNWGNCHRCGRCAHRRNLLFGVGNPAAALMLIQSLPSYHEDKRGFPFAGDDVGQVMSDLVRAANLDVKEDLYITHAVKCPGALEEQEDGTHRRKEPSAEEIATCKVLLMQQIEIVKPAVILLQGKFAHKIITGDSRPLTKVVGHARSIGDKCIAISTHNPAGLMMGDRVKLWPEYYRDWYSALAKLNLVGRLWRPDAPTFAKGWVLPEGFPR